MGLFFPQRQPVTAALWGRAGTGARRSRCSDAQKAVRLESNAPSAAAYGITEAASRLHEQEDQPLR